MLKVNSLSQQRIEFSIVRARKTNKNHRFQPIGNVILVDICVNANRKNGNFQLYFCHLTAKKSTDSRHNLACRKNLSGSLAAINGRYYCTQSHGINPPDINCLLNLMVDAHVKRASQEPRRHFTD